MTSAIIKTETKQGGQVRISGWYTDINWTSDVEGEYKAGSGNSFLFSLRDDMKFIKLRCTNKEIEVYHYENWLCCFGARDLRIVSDCNVNSNNWSLLDDAYE